MFLGTKQKLLLKITDFVASKDVPGSSTSWREQFVNLVEHITTKEPLCAYLASEDVTQVTGDQASTPIMLARHPFQVRLVTLLFMTQQFKFVSLPPTIFMVRHFDPEECWIVQVIG
jgi:hypothetical protein